jgi:hypothetical protein
LSLLKSPQLDPTIADINSDQHWTSIAVHRIRSTGR